MTELKKAVERFFFVRLYGDLWRVTCARGHKLTRWIGPYESAFTHPCKCGADVVGAGASHDERLIPSLLKTIRSRAELAAYDRLASKLERMEADLDRIGNAAMYGYPELIGAGYKQLIKEICLRLSEARQEPVTAEMVEPVDLLEIQS